MEDTMDEAIETLQQDLERDMTARRASREQKNFMQTQIDSLKHEIGWYQVLALFAFFLALFAFFGWGSTALGWWLL